MRKILPLVALALLAAAPAPTPGELKVFGTWTVGCDNGRACQANALMSPESDDGLQLVLRRAAEPGAGAQLDIPTDGIKGPGVFAIDGQEFARLSPGPGPRTIPVTAQLAARLANGTKATVTVAGKEWAAVRLTGVAAAFLYIDDKQGRIGTTTALRRTGPTVANTAPPALPVIARPAAGAKPARGIAPAALRKLIGTDATDCEEGGKLDPTGVRLDPAHSLVLVGHPCGNGAYNLFASAFVVDEAGKAVRARFDYDAGMGAGEPSDELVNADWDAKQRLLTTYAKGRSVGDCGSDRAFAWDGTMFRLVSERRMDECGGSIDFIPTWRATIRDGG